MFSYMDIYKIAGRFLERIMTTNRNPNDYKDDLYAYFIFCHHLRDYLIKDAKVPRAAVDCYIDENHALTISRKITNLTKHRNFEDTDYGKSHYKLSLTASIAVASVEVKGEIISNVCEGSEIPFSKTIEPERKIRGLKETSLNDSVGIDQYFEIIDSSNNAHDALAIAQECYNLWTVFMERYNLFE